MISVSPLVPSIASRHSLIALCYLLLIIVLHRSRSDLLRGIWRPSQNLPEETIIGNIVEKKIVKNIDSNNKLFNNIGWSVFLMFITHVTHVSLYTIKRIYCEWKHSQYSNMTLQCLKLELSFSFAAQNCKPHFMASFALFFPQCHKNAVCHLAKNGKVDGCGACGTHLTFCSSASNFHQSRDSGGSPLTADSKERWVGAGIGDWPHLNQLHPGGTSALSLNQNWAKKELLHMLNT